MNERIPRSRELPPREERERGTERCEEFRTEYGGSLRLSLEMAQTDLPYGYIGLFGVGPARADLVNLTVGANEYASNTQSGGGYGDAARSGGVYLSAANVGGVVGGAAGLKVLQDGNRFSLTDLTIICPVTANEDTVPGCSYSIDVQNAGSVGPFSPGIAYLRLDGTVTTNNLLAIGITATFNGMGGVPNVGPKQVYGLYNSVTGSQMTDLGHGTFSFDNTTWQAAMIQTPVDAWLNMHLVISLNAGDELSMPGSMGLTLAPAPVPEPGNSLELLLAICGILFWCGPLRQKLSS